MSCAGNGYLTGNMLVPYPFEDGQMLQWGADANAAQLALQRCFVDAVVNVDSYNAIKTGWPSIGCLYKGKDAVSFVLTAHGIDVSLAVSASELRFPVISGKTGFGWYSVVMSSEGIRDFCSSSFVPPTSDMSDSAGRSGGSWLRICSRCISQRPRELTSIQVYDGVNPKETGPHFSIAGDVVLKPGNNFLLGEPDEENAVSLSAIPGAGLGVVPRGCGEHGVGNVELSGPDGHARLFNDTCYDVEPYISETQDGEKEGVLQIHVKCTACCTCKMYASIVNDRLAVLADMIRKARADILDNASRYEDAVLKFNERLVRTTLDDVTLTLTGMPVVNKISAKAGTGRKERCSFVAILRNSSYATVIAKMYKMNCSSTIVETTASLQNENGEMKVLTSESEYGMVGGVFELPPGHSLSMTYIAREDRYVEDVVPIKYTSEVMFGISCRLSDGTVKSIGNISKAVEV